MGFEVILRNARRPPGQAVAQHAFDERPVDCARMVEIDPGAASG